ncbi:hypothetical protein [Streptomyces hebeiensis]
MLDRIDAVLRVMGPAFGGTGYGKGGEELVFAQRRGEKTVRFWHSDADWQMFRVGDHSVRVGSVM